MPRSPRIPRPYVKKNQLVVCLRDARSGHRRTIYLGAENSPEALKKYARVLAEWEAGDRIVPPPRTAIRRQARPTDIVTVAEIVLGYFKSVKARHSHAEVLNAHGHAIRNALRCLREQAGDQAAIDFGPKMLKKVRLAMVASGRFNRSIVNKNTRYITAAFKWAVGEELIPARVYDALSCLEPIKRGEVPTLRESKIVSGVADAIVDATLPELPTPIRGLVETMRLTGARCGELTGLRPIDIDTTGKVWRAQLAEHKTAHHGKERVLWFGPQSQEILKPFLNRDVSAPLFSPAESMAELRHKRRQNRTTPESCGNSPGTNRKDHPQRQPGLRYDTVAVRQAIARACKRAFPAPAEHTMTPAELDRWHKEHRWTPHQLRHAAATRIRKAAGLEAAAVVLGHSSAVLTDATYAERDETTAINVLAKIG